MIRLDGMKNGLSRLGPFSATNTVAASMVLSPPMPEPIITPVRSWLSSSSGVHPESSTASTAAHSA